MRIPASIAFQAAALLGAAAICALVSNGLAHPARHLAWTAAPPPAAVPVPTQLQEATQPALPAPKSGLTATPRPGPQTASQPIPTPPRPAQPIREISSKEAKEAFRGGVPFLDARRSAEYELGHIQGAWSLPIWESALEERLIEFEAKTNRPPEGALVLYCSGGSCEDSHLLASRLFQMGYRNLLIYREGYPDWIAQKLPITKGAS